MKKQVNLSLIVLLLICQLSYSSLYAQRADTTHVNKYRLAVVAGTTTLLYAGMMSYLEFVWYQDKERVPFHFYNDWKGYNQIDKLGHAYGSYVESYVSAHALMWAGVPRKKAAIYGGAIGFLMQLPIEVWDGMYEGWGFSLPDVGANAVGSLLFIGNELAFGEQRLLYKFSFSPSPYAPMANGYLGTGFNQLFNDYNGHTYWLSYGLKDLIPAAPIPRWLNVAVGYGAGGMFGEFENRKRFRGVDIPETQRYRKWLLSLDINFSKIPTRNKVLKAIFNSMFIVKVPMPTLEYNTKSEWHTHSFYY
jgi:hypothetical protein